MIYIQARGPCAPPAASKHVGRRRRPCVRPGHRRRLARAGRSSSDATSRSVDDAPPDESAYAGLQHSVRARCILPAIRLVPARWVISGSQLVCQLQEEDRSVRTKQIDHLFRTRPIWDPGPDDTFLQRFLRPDPLLDVLCSRRRALAVLLFPRQAGVCFRHLRQTNYHANYGGITSPVVMSQPYADDTWSIMLYALILRADPAHFLLRLSYMIRVEIG